MKLINQKGFFALFSVVIISFVLILITVTLNYLVFYTHYNIFNIESKIQSKYLAEACVESARLKLAQDKNFLGNDIIINIDKYNCNYSIINTSPFLTIISKSIINNSYTYLEVLVDINNSEIPIISFNELTDYP